MGLNAIQKDGCISSRWTPRNKMLIILPRDSSHNCLKAIVCASMAGNLLQHIFYLFHINTYTLIPCMPANLHIQEEEDQRVDPEIQGARNVIKEETMRVLIEIVKKDCEKLRLKIE